MGWNFKFTDLQAVLGLEQMKKLPVRVERKKQIYRLYREALQAVPGLTLIPTRLEDTSPWFIDVLVRDGRREELMRFLKERGIGTRPFYPALHAEPVYGRTSEHYPAAERIAREGLWLPSASKLTDDEVRRVTDVIRAFFAGG